ncbi:Lysophospholipase, alpha-beta hydrolase superfamily [Neorhodopirellula lusitana]|uniref:Lysophospholipase, alpha-beta hydrolase superfamily n=1 Tax=Neorhodopirellula lusitana TaxID=445327 RepID=A0ABY1PT55_9BACT|nr:alpha/beta fold hydrolase [Neorhodopirellula lusitana]SMP46534.1 Lysophospholipase, alpha-beta hydrolase superfamily [Neorhodopirellula lusitana]
MLHPDLVQYRGHQDARLAARVWQVDRPTADVICLHGIISHSGWYEASGSHLASAGVNVHLLDRRGSGLSQGPRGDVDCWTTWVSDVVHYLRGLPNERPKVLMGISWGGILATTIARQYPTLINGLALVCPGLFSRKAANQVQRTALRLANAIGIKKHRVSIPLRDPALFTNSSVWQNYIANDPLTLRKITIDFAMNNLTLLDEATQIHHEIAMPVLLMLASNDPITDNEPTRQFVERMGSTDETIIEYFGASHTLEFEDDSSKYFADLAEWCQRVALNSNGSDRNT